MRLEQEQVQALWHLANMFMSFSVAIPVKDRWLMLRVENAHLAGKEWRRA
ncbi:MAG TPA: hypothetical protein VNB49_10595 [Candidatus Dormibacteraeota bacterium]|nr:hypothetical protein [Candidatus Dormibacteraeota bacterium]